MNSLNYLRTIFATLKAEEINSLEKFVLYRMDEDEARNSKTAQLIKLILAEEKYSSNDIQKTIYGKLNYSAFNKLVNRLKDKTLEILMFDSSLQNGNYSDRSKAIFELRKRIIQIDLLILKGMRNRIKEEIELVIKKADEMEIYDVLIQSLYTKQRFSGLEMGTKKASKLKEEIRKAELKWTSLNSSQSKYNEMISKISSSSSYKSYKSDLAETLSFLKNEFNKSSAPTIGYFYYLLLVEQIQNEKRYEDASAYLTILLQHVQKNKSVYSDYRMGSISLNISNNNIFEKKLIESMDYIELAKKYFTNQPLNLSILNEIEFFNLFYQGKLKEADIALSTLVKFSRSLNSSLLLQKRLFFMGSLEFLKGDFEKARQIISSCEEIDKDKGGWNIIKRVMVTLCRIELKDLESADMKLSNLDKFIKRVLKTKSIRPRYLIIIRILRKLINENFDYSKVYNSRKKYFDLLESTDSDYCWEIKSPELIIFEEWFRSKTIKKSYDHQKIMSEKFNVTS